MGGQNSFDEPFEHTSRMPATRRCLEVMKTIPGLRTEEDGGQTASGEFKMDNGWSFADYDATRRLMADAIAELDQRP